MLIVLHRLDPVEPVLPRTGCVGKEAVVVVFFVEDLAPTVWNHHPAQGRFDEHLSRQRKADEFSSSSRGKVRPARMIRVHMRTARSTFSFAKVLKCSCVGTAHGRFRITHPFHPLRRQSSTIG